MSTIDLTYQTHSEQRWLYATCHAANGWDRWKYGFGYFGLGKVDYPGDRRVEVRVNLVAKPNYLVAKLTPKFPEDWACKEMAEFAYYLLDSGKLLVLFPVEFLLERAQLDAFETMRVWNPSRLLARHESCGWYLEVASWLCVYPPPNRRPGTTKEYDTPFWQGGLPGLGRR